MGETIETVVEGCSTCPFAFLSDGCLPTCVLTDYEGIGGDPDGSRVQYDFRDTAPEWCPLRQSARLITLGVGR